MSRGWLALVAVCLWPVAAMTAEVDFDRDVRPILSSSCFTCHGPDDAERKAHLRLDTQAGLFGTIKDRTTVKAKDAGHSELFRRITSDDADERMPPAKGGKVLKPEQVAIIRQWIEQGAPYKGHWAFTGPKKSELPSVKHADWARNEIDRFLLARQEAAGLSPNPEADRYALVRRLTLDLTGLPPTPQEISAFVFDNRPDAYEKLVDRLLASPHYGERMARPWLDLARYADSAGYGSDPLRRTIHRYRDWVIDAFNSNQPYDRFSVEQLAGDLLPNPTQDQLLATAFHRNTMTNTEGGTDDEEWRNAAVKDRGEVTFQVWMGLTMGCAQCHTHKYDPITNQEYYQTFAFFNQSEDSDKDDERPTIPTPTPDQAQTQAKLQAQIAEVQKQIDDPAFLSSKQSAWEEHAVRDADDGWLPLKVQTATSTGGATLTAQTDGSILASGPRGKTDTYSLEIVTDLKNITAFRLEAIADSALPNRGPGRADTGDFAVSNLSIFAKSGPPGPLQGRYVRVEQPRKETWLHLAEVQVWAGDKNIAPAGKASQSSIGFDGEAQRAIDGNTDGDYDHKSVSHTEREDDPWWEVDLGSPQPVDRVTVWNRTDHGASQRLYDFRVVVYNDQHKEIWSTRIGPSPQPSVELQPALGVPVELKDASATFAAADNDAAKTIDADAGEKSAWAIAPQVGRSHSLVVQTTKPVGGDGQTTLKVAIAQNRPDAPLGRFRLLASTRPMPSRDLPHAIRQILASGPASRTEAEKNELAEYYRGISPEVKESQQKIASLQKQIDGLSIARTAVMRELPADKRRDSFVLVKGNFMSHGPKVEPIVPAAFNPMPPGAPANRLGLAMWLVDKQNPLTARVEVNRLWAIFFGLGIVETQEDFGTQGSPPSHPELLDTLAVEFMDSGWDIKAMVKRIVMSAAYRQSTRVSPEALQIDPRNRLLARAPRPRLDAEQVRDQALSIAGLLSLKMHGPSVFPPQPEGLWQAAFNGERTWATSSGEDKYRRGLYTFWRRTVPYPSMAAFDAPSREQCTLRRISTSTPLQAFVTLNDPVYVEAAQALARRIVKEGGGSPRERAKFALELCLGRPPTADRLQQIVALYENELPQFRSDAASAMKLATEPLGKLPEGSDPAETAAWTVVANVLLNMDGVLTRS